MMELVRVSEIDLNGFLFVNYPTTLSLEESRERLELEIMFAAFEDGADNNEVFISPYWLQRILHKRATDAFNKMTPSMKRKAVLEAREWFKANRRKPKTNDSKLEAVKG